MARIPPQTLMHSPQCHGIIGSLDETLGSIVWRTLIASTGMIRVQKGVTCCMKVPFLATI